MSPTEAGERLLVSVGPRFEEIEAEIEALSELRDKPAGTIRITAGEHAVNTILWPRLENFLPQFPDIKVEIYIENRLTDIVAERYDAGVRLGEHVAKDMIAVRMGPDWRLIVVGSPSYFAGRELPSESPPKYENTDAARPMAIAMPSDGIAARGSPVTAHPIARPSTPSSSTTASDEQDRVALVRADLRVEGRCGHGVCRQGRRRVPARDPPWRPSSG